MKAFTRCRLQGRKGSDLQKRQSPIRDKRLCREWIREFVDYHKGIAQQFLKLKLSRVCGGSGSESSEHTLLGKNRRGGRESISRSSYSSLHLSRQGSQCFLCSIWSNINPSSATFHRRNEKMLWGWGRGQVAAIRWKIGWHSPWFPLRNWNDTFPVV